jgi:radical SAM superfamily enzyme YgiQ (UPF0313 family)
MVEFVFVTAGRIPLGQKILMDKLEERGITTKIISMQTLYSRIFDEKGENSFFSKRKTEEFKLGVEAYLRSVKSKIEGAQFFGMTFFDTIGEKETSFVISRAIKKHFPNSTLIAGGPAFNSNPNSFLKESGADYAIRGEAEKSLPRLIEIISKRKEGTIGEIPGIMFRKNGKIYSHPIAAKLAPEEIQNSKFTYIKEGKIAFTYSERGCKNACIFCTIPRKGNPIMINTKTIIEGLEKLAENKEIEQVSFLDDHFFSDTKRANELLDEIIKRKLNKRFVFECAATVESLLKNGKPNLAFMRKIKRAGILGMEIGLEALNDNMLKELKGNRYTKIQAIELLKALQKNGFETNNYLLAGGINTRAKDFMESYYSALRLEMKGTTNFYPTSMIEATKGTTIHRVAEKENALFTMTGRNVKPTREGRTGFRLAIPKDEELRKLFLEKLRKREGRQFTSDDLPRVIKMGKESKDRVAQKYARKLQKIQGENKANNTLLEKIAIHIRTRIVADEMQKRGIKLTGKNVTDFLKESQTKQAIENKSYQIYQNYLMQRMRIANLRGIERLRAIQKLRKATGMGLTFEFNPKKYNQRLRR